MPRTSAPPPVMIGTLNSEANDFAAIAELLLMNR